MGLSAPEYIEELHGLRGWYASSQLGCSLNGWSLVESFLDERGNSTDCLHCAMQLLFAAYLNIEPLPPMSIAANFLNHLRRGGTSVFYQCQNRTAYRTWYSKAFFIFAMTLAAPGLNLRGGMPETLPR
jgi:hypothetical protein